MKWGYWAVLNKKTSGSHVGFPSSTAVPVQVGGALSDLHAVHACSSHAHAVQCSGRGSEPPGLDLIIRSGANFDNAPSRNSQH